MMIRSNRPTIAWYSLDRRTASGSTTSLVSYTNPPVSAAPARAVRSGRDARYDRDHTGWVPVFMFVSFIVGLLWFSIAFWQAHSSVRVHTISLPARRHMGCRTQID